MNQEKQPEALRLAGVLRETKRLFIMSVANELEAAAAELRRQHTRIAELEAQLSAIGAGGVEALRKRAQAIAVQDDALTTAMKKAVEVGIFPKYSIGEETYLRNWYAMKAVLEAALPAQEHATQLAGKGHEMGEVELSMEPVGEIQASSELGVAPYASIWPWLQPGTKLYTAAQVLAMGRVPPTPAEIERLAVKHEAFGFGQVDSKGLTTHSFDTDGLAEFVNDLFAAAPRPPAAQERRPLTDEQIDAALVAWFGNDQCLEAGYQYRMRRAINAAHGITHPTGD